MSILLKRNDNSKVLTDIKSKMMTQGKNKHEFWNFFGGKQLLHLKTLRKVFFPLTNTYVIKNN